VDFSHLANHLHAVLQFDGDPEQPKSAQIVQLCLPRSTLQRLRLQLRPRFHAPVQRADFHFTNTALVARMYREYGLFKVSSTLVHQEDIEKVGNHDNPSHSGRKRGTYRHFYQI